MRFSGLGDGEGVRAGEPVPRLSHLLVVAGPSGVGKTLLLQRIRRDDAPDVLSAMLPAGIAAWRRMDAALVSAALDEGGLGCEPLLLHYNLVRGMNLGFRRDAALSLIGSAEKVTVITLVDDSVDLISRQLVSRTVLKSTNGEARRRARVAATTMGALGNVVRRFEYVWLGRASALAGRGLGVPERSLESLRHYWQRHWLSDCYDQWRAFIADAAPPGSALVEIEPDRKHGEERFQWRIRPQHAYTGPSAASGGMRSDTADAADAVDLQMSALTPK